MPVHPYPVPPSSSSLTIVAWAAVILISALPDVAWAELTGAVPAWLAVAKMGLALFLALAAFLWKPLRPLSKFFIIMAAFFGLSTLRLRLNFTFLTIALFR